MTQPVLVKVYGAFYPVDQAFFKALGPLAMQAAPPEPDSLSLDGDMLKISFEGICFPAEEVAELVAQRAPRGLQGKMDLLDLENWRMTRFEISHGELRSSTAPLNNVLAYSGF